MWSPVGSSHIGWSGLGGFLFGGISLQRNSCWVVSFQISPVVDHLLNGLLFGCLILGGLLLGGLLFGSIPFRMIFCMVVSCQWSHGVSVLLEGLLLGDLLLWSYVK